VRKIVIGGRGLVEGYGGGELLVSPEPISFYGGVDPLTGVVREPNHPLEGKSIAGKILVFPRGKGSTVGSYVLLSLKDRGKAPAGIVNIRSEPIIIVGCVLAEVPLMDRPDKNPLEVLKSGMWGRITVQGRKARLEVIP